MKIISITSTSSGSGKTTLAAFLIKTLGKTNALKITVQHMGACPKEIDCDGCPTMGDLTFKIITDPVVLKQPGKDTAQFLKAGAEKVVWLQTQRKHLGTAIDHVLSLFPPAGLLIVEGNSFLSLREVSYAIMVTTPGAIELKPSATKILKKINLFVINKKPSHTKKDIEQTREKLLSFRANCPIVVLDPFHPKLESRAILLKSIRKALQEFGAKEYNLVS